MYFNSRTSQEVRHKRQKTTLEPLYFNSRTSQEVRPFSFCQLKFTMNFNSRTSQEVRRIIQMPDGWSDDFNSRTSQEVRLKKHWCSCNVDHFNSRTSQEVRPAELIKDGKVAKISTHVPHKRYDWIRFTQYRQQYRFQLTYLTRGTTKDLCPFIQRNNFNSRTSQEVRQQILLLILTLTTIFALN